MELSVRHRIALRLQRLSGQLNLFWFGPFFILILRCVGGYRCLDQKAVRTKLEEILAKHPNQPVLICANHLTMIDSLLITRFLMSFRSLFTHFERFPWNVPELKNFGINPLTRAMCYLGKCVYVERDGNAESKRLSWSKITWLNRQGDFICIFPEGGRSRIGRIDRNSAVYGVGQLVQNNPKTLVICAYLRGKQQTEHSYLPKRGEDFFLDVAKVDCKITPGRRGQREITLQIFDQLEVLEQKYFATRN